MKRKIGVSRKKRVRGGGKEEDLLRVIGAPNPQVNESLFFIRPLESIINGPDVADFKFTMSRTFITTYGQSKKNVKEGELELFHEEGYRYPNSYLLYFFKNAFLWPMCIFNMRGASDQDLERETSYIIQRSNICNIFGILFMRFKIIYEKKRNGLFTQINQNEYGLMLNEIQSIVYLFINLIFACPQWQGGGDIVIVNEIQRMPLSKFQKMFTSIIVGKEILSTNFNPIDIDYIRCYMSIQLNGYNYIKNLFDRAITKLYMIGEPLLANRRLYTEVEFASVFEDKRYTRIGTNNLALYLPDPLPAIIPVLSAENKVRMNREKADRERANKESADRKKEREKAAKKKADDEYWEERARQMEEMLAEWEAENAAKKVLASKNSQPSGGGTRRTRRIRRTRRSRV